MKELSLGFDLVIQYFGAVSWFEFYLRGERLLKTTSGKSYSYSHLSSYYYKS